MPGATLTTAVPVRRSRTKGHGGVQPSASKTRPRAPRRAGSAKTAPKPRDVEGRRVGDLDGAGQPEGVEVGLGEGDPQRVEVHARGGQAGAGEGQQVAADAAPEVDDAGRSGGREARRAVLGHPEAGSPARARRG